MKYRNPKKESDLFRFVRGADGHVTALGGVGFQIVALNGESMPLPQMVR